jgi:hypothetical protein
MQSLVWPKQIFGGTQAIKVYVTNIETRITPHPQYTNLEEMATVVTIWIEMKDTFGADHNNGERWNIPGLVEMYVLQHHRNNDTSSATCDTAPCYVPFSHRVLIPYKLFYHD